MKQMNEEYEFCHNMLIEQEEKRRYYISEIR